MASAGTLTRPAVDEITEKFDSVDCVDNRYRHQHGDVEPGRYIQVQGAEDALLIPLGIEVMHIGRGLTADLHLDDSSVSRRHSILISRPSGARILDDRSFNGTFINGRRVEQADLHSGDTIVLGRVRLRYLEL
jgi:pSer/pThr/pTyr-binding forkhead associated (FHA) protein